MNYFWKRKYAKDAAHVLRNEGKLKKRPDRPLISLMKLCKIGRFFFFSFSQERKFALNSVLDKLPYINIILNVYIFTGFYALKNSVNRYIIYSSSFTYIFKGIRI